MRSRAICRKLPVEALTELQHMGRRRILAKGEALAWQGSGSSYVANILSGRVKLAAYTRSGREQIVGVIGAGGFVGRMDVRKEDHSVVALVDTELCQFPRVAFAEFVQNHPELESAMLERAVYELDRSRRWLLMLGRGTAAERIAALLIDFADDDSEGPHQFPLSRGQIADLAGLTIETVSRQLTRLKRAGVIELEGRSQFTIRNRDALNAIAGGGTEEDPD